MLRVFLVGLLALPLTACGKSEATPPATNYARAGVVVDIAGKVTATRDGTTRELAKGGEVSGDDVIATAADGKVTIELAHNNARWSLIAGKSAKLSESPAWTLPMADKIADTVSGDTSAAGLHAEKSAADTAATATKDTAAKTEPVPPKTDPEKPMVPSTGTGTTTVSPGGTAGSGAAAGSGLDAVGIHGTGEGGGGSKTGGGGLGSIGSIGRGGGTGQGTGYGTGNGSLGGSHNSRPPKVTVETPTAGGGTGTLTAQQIQVVMRTRMGVVRLCYEQGLARNPTLSGKVVVKFTIDKTGAVTSAEGSGMDETVATCIATRVKAFKFPDAGAETTVNFPFVFSPPQ